MTYSFSPSVVIWILPGEAGRDVADELRRVALVAIPDQPRNHQLADAVDAGPRPHAPMVNGEELADLGGDVAVLPVDEGPDLIALHATGWQVAQRPVLVVAATLPRQPAAGELCSSLAGHPHGGEDRVPFYESGQDCGAAGWRQLVHKAQCIYIRHTRKESLALALYIT